MPATKDAQAIAWLRTTVGNSSLAYKKTMPNDAAIPNLPIMASVTEIHRGSDRRQVYSYDRCDGDEKLLPFFFPKMRKWERETEREREKNKSTKIKLC